MIDTDPDRLSLVTCILRVRDHDGLGAETRHQVCDIPRQSALVDHQHNRGTAPIKSDKHGQE